MDSNQRTSIVHDLVDYNRDYFAYELYDAYGDFSGGEGIWVDVEDMVDNDLPGVIQALEEDIAESNNPQQIEDAKYIIEDIKSCLEGDEDILSSTNMFGDDDGPFTRDDEIDYIETPLYDRFPEITGCRAYIDKNANGRYLLSVDIQTDSGYDFTVDDIIDLRKIKKPSDLGRYVNSIANKYLAEVEQL